MSKGRKSRGQLSPEDRALWERVTSTTTPLHPHKPLPVAELPEEAAQEGLQKGKKPARTATSILTPSKPLKPPAPPPLAPMERKTRRKLVRGTHKVDSRIDLHGLTQHEAHDRLRGFLYHAQSRGHKLVLVITGKGGGGGYMDERGVLRRSVPQWLAMPDLRHIVLGYEEAHLAHGGSGALYVRLRRRKLP